LVGVFGDCLTFPGDDDDPDFDADAADDAADFVVAVVALLAYATGDSEDGPESAVDDGFTAGDGSGDESRLETPPAGGNRNGSRSPLPDNNVEVGDSSMFVDEAELAFAWGDASEVSIFLKFKLTTLMNPMRSKRSSKG
jgi:hypothetical protein